MPPKKQASAPKPKQGGYDAAKQRQERAQKVYRIQLKDSDFSIVYRPSIPIQVRSHIRDVTGKAPDVLLFGSNGRDVSMYADMWWIQRLVAGEEEAIEIDGRPVRIGKLRRETVQDEFDAACPGAEWADFDEIDISDEVHDSPEA